MNTARPWGKILIPYLRSDLENHPLYLNEDETGQLYRVSVKQDKSGTYTIDEVPVSNKEVKELDAAFRGSLKRVCVAQPQSF